MGDVMKDLSRAIVEATPDDQAGPSRDPQKLEQLIGEVKVRLGKVKSHLQKDRPPVGFLVHEVQRVIDLLEEKRND